jgi:F0F1-type ATP synthase assembly protein I
MPLLPPDQARALGALATVGLSFVLAIVIGVGAGIWLDRKLGTSPWLFFLFLALGFSAGVVNIYRATRNL